MTIALASQGSLFTSDYLTGSIQNDAEWAQIADSDLDSIRDQILKRFEAFPIDKQPNESATEKDLIWPVIEALGWSAYSTQVNLSARGRQDVPDVVLFESDEKKQVADASGVDLKSYELGSVVVESKRWQRPLDRRSSKANEQTAPSTQMLRYLRRIDDLTDGALRWGILTNGAKWRLYFSGARSVSEQFFELDLVALLGLPGHNDGAEALDEESRQHWFKVFVLIFRREAFVAAGAIPKTYHERILDEGKFYEKRVAENLSNKVFGEVFPNLARAIAHAAPNAPLQEVREGALILLYRLLFIFYAEDRDLLPVKDTRYDDYGLREKVRMDVGDRKDADDVFSDTAARYWASITDLFMAIDKGDASIGLPPYNGGLFQQERTPVIDGIRISDEIMADVIDALSFEQTDDGRKYINYRNLSVQQLGSIYERLLEFEIVRQNDEIAVQPSTFARKGSGSYYTPDDLVQLILTETLEPLVAKCKEAFTGKLDELMDSSSSNDLKFDRLKMVDPATSLLKLKICDPAMGSGHFLVSLVDYLADNVIEAMAEAEHSAPKEWGDYVSPLGDKIDEIRRTILINADDQKWTVDDDQLDDRHIIRRMILKRCVYGVDKNTMAVELAKVALWLHTFTVGAPLSFLDHHLRCGNSLFGSWVKTGVEKAMSYECPLLLHGPIEEALESAAKMQRIEGFSDAEVAEAHHSAKIFKQIERETAKLNALLCLIHAIDWQNIRGREDRAALRIFFSGQLGDPLAIAMGKAEPDTRSDAGKRFSAILSDCRELMVEENFFNWQVAFPGVWEDWEADEMVGGFDAVIGNPPWDRMKLQQVEWFADRRREIAVAARAADRNNLIKQLIEENDSLASEFLKAAAHAEQATNMARRSGDYPLLSRGDINLYSLFVERAMNIVKQDGLIGLLVPSGIAADKTASEFFKGVATAGRLKSLYDFENRKIFFPDVHGSFKFCVFVASPTAVEGEAKCAFYLHSLDKLHDTDVCFTLGADDFARVNPNTGTAPIFRSSHDADLTKKIYANSQVLVDKSSGIEQKAWPVKYMTMFHMTNDSGLFRTRVELEEEMAAYPIGGNRFENADGQWVPLYVGRMIHQFDHRAASVQLNEDNVHNAALSGEVSEDQKADPSFVPTPQYWVHESEVELPEEMEWAIAFRDIARATDVRTMIASILPKVGVANTAPLIIPDGQKMLAGDACLILGNWGSIVFDYTTRQKAQSTHLNWYIVEQLPVVKPRKFDDVHFGDKSAADVVKEAVLELTYTAHDMAPFAIDMGYVDDEGNVKPPFIWDKERRLILRAKLDAVFFHLYGITDREDIRYIYGTFPIVEREEIAEYGTYRSRELCLAYMNALASGKPDAKIDI